jgi:KDO2-lipid IV(A) lauroyltransferase
MRVSRYLPRPVLRWLAWAGANVSWLRGGRSRKRLEDNLHRVTGLEGRDLSRLSRRGLVTAARYYSEVLEMPRVTPEQADARLRILNPDQALPAIHAGGGTVIALGHSGNWDLVGYYSTRAILPVTSVAEVLEPREVFDQFVALRERIGIRIYGHEGSATFKALLREAKGDEPRIIALVSDRDLSGTGIEVTMWGRTVKVAPGPAALAKASGRPLFPLIVYSERLTGARRRAAKSRWGYVMHFGPELRPQEFDGPDAIVKLTQQWAAWLAKGIEEHPEDWHMLQRFGWVESAEEAT